MRVIEQMDDVVLAAGEIVVDAQNVVAIAQQSLAQMRTEESGPSCHQNALSCQSHVRNSQVSERGNVLILQWPGIRRSGRRRTPFGRTGQVEGIDPVGGSFGRADPTAAACVAR